MVGCGQHSGAALGPGPNGLPQPGACQRLDSRRRLVEDQKLGVVSERRSEGDPTSQTERQVANEDSRGCADLRIEASRHDPMTERPSREREILCDGKVLVQAQRLRHVPEPPSRVAARRAAEEGDRARRRAQ